jgi:uncharacterized protein
VIYLDSSALLKLLFEERESAALETWLGHRSGTPAISSELARVEVLRAVRRLDAAALAAAQVLLSQLDIVPLTSAVIEQAGSVGAPVLRTLDALHMASALSIRDELTAFVAYETRLAASASAEGLEVGAPS